MQGSHWPNSQTSPGNSLQAQGKTWERSPVGQLQYNQLLPTGNSSPPARFYGLPKIHKANCPMCPIVSACGTSTYNLAKYLTKILKVYVGHSFSFVKDSKDLMDKLQSIKLQDNEELVSFDVSALFTSIPVNQALDVINQLIILSCTEVFQGIRFFFIIVKYRNYPRCSRNQYRLMLHLMFHLLERSVKLCKDVR